MLKPNFKADVQKAFGYAIYMIADSYWDKTQCATPKKEMQQLLFNYKEAGLSKQYAMEKLAILFMDKVAEHVPEKFFKMSVKVDFVEHNNDTEVRFTNGSYEFCIVGKYKKNVPVIRYKLTKK